MITVTFTGLVTKSGVVTATVLHTKISEVENKILEHAKYIISQEFNKLTAEHFTAIIEQADLVNKTDFNNKLTSFNKRIASNKTKQNKSKDTK